MRYDDREGIREEGKMKERHSWPDGTQKKNPVGIFKTKVDKTSINFVGSNNYLTRCIS